MSSSADHTKENGEFEAVWQSAYDEARRVAISKGLPQAAVAHCAEVVADAVLNRHIRRLEGDQTTA